MKNNVNLPELNNTCRYRSQLIAVVISLKKKLYIAYNVSDDKIKTKRKLDN